MARPEDLAFLLTEDQGLPEHQPEKRELAIRVELIPTHLAIDIQGNFFRGLMGGFLAGTLFGVALAYGAFALTIGLVGHL